MSPYYQHGGQTIYLGDCREILPTLGRFDLLLTDPPYGIKADDRRQILSRGKLAAARDYGESDWDSGTDEIGIALARVNCDHHIIFGGNYYPLPPSKCWLVWDKENGTNDFADAEMAWTNLNKAVRLIRHMWNGMLRKGGEDRFHPTQKPLDVIAWALRQAPDSVQTVLDPFMGSGTTLRACKDLGKQCTGIEREERYCEIAARRLEQEVLAL